MMSSQLVLSRTCMAEKLLCNTVTGHSCTTETCYNEVIVFSLLEVGKSSIWKLVCSIISSHVTCNAYIIIVSTLQPRKKKAWVDVDYFCRCRYRFFSIIFNDFDVDFFIIAISIILFAGPDLRFRGPCADQVTGAFNYIKIAMFYFWGPLNTRGPVLQHRQHSA
jgi:hypothetical protein